MKTSESMKEIAPAIVQAFAEVKNAFKSTKGHGYKYAPLPEVLDDIRPVLSKHGLAVIQAPKETEKMMVGIETIILHESGEWIMSDLCMPVEPDKRNSLAQVYGAVITYARRYAITSMMGISSTDEDTDAHIERPEYTEDQKTRYHKFVDENDALGIALLRKEITLEAWTDLYDTFPKGQKTKLKAQVDKMDVAGQESIDEYIAQISDATKANDIDTAINLGIEIRSSYGDMAASIIKSLLSNEVAHELKQQRKAA